MELAIYLEFQRSRTTDPRDGKPILRKDHGVRRYCRLCAEELAVVSFLAKNIETEGFCGNLMDFSWKLFNFERRSIKIN